MPDEEMALAFSRPFGGRDHLCGDEDVGVQTERLWCSVVVQMGDYSVFR